MNTKNLDAIKRMIVRLQSIEDTENLTTMDIWNISSSISCLQNVVDKYESEKQDDSVR